MDTKTTMEKPVNDFDFIESIFIGAIDACALKESINLKLFDHLLTPRTAAEAAEITGTDEGAIKALLSLLEGRKLVTIIDNRYMVTPASAEFLVSTSPFYQGNSLLWQRKNCEHIISNMSELLKKPGMHAGCISKKFSDGMKGIIEHAMRGFLQDTVEFIEKLPGFNDARWLCDIGGNHGKYTAALLDCNSNLHGVIADLPDVAAEIKHIYTESAYRDRLSVIPCNLLTDYLPEKTYDIVLTSYVLQIFGDKLEQVIRKIAATIVPGGWFVTQNMTDYGTDSLYMNAINLMTELTVKANHFIPETLLIRLLEEAGFCDILTGRTGMNKSDLIIAGRKKC